MRQSRFLVLIAALLSALGGCSKGAVAPIPGAARTTTVLLVADIHFNPFAKPEIVGTLARTPPSGWPAIFAGAHLPKETGYRYDTNETLLETSVAAMKQAAPDPGLVMIAGDFLAHGFRGLYEDASKRRDEASYDRFVDATIAYLAVVFQAAYPHARFAITVGNNDNACDDYESTPHSPFLSHMTAAWAPLVDRDDSAPDFPRTFPEGGWYDEALPFAHTRLLVPNSVYWSTGFTNRCGNKKEPIGLEQQAALEQRLAAQPASTHWWMLTHIPPGIDSFASLRRLGLRTMYRPQWLAKFLALHTTSGRAFDLIVAGHTHMNDFRLARGAGGRGVAPVLLLPSITRYGANDPAFLVAEVAPDATISDYTAYHDSAQFFGLGGRSWSTEYRFDDAFGVRGVSAETLAQIQSRLATDEVLRDQFYGEWYASGSLLGVLVRSTWHRTWCAQTELQPNAYLRCRGKT